MTQLFKHRSFKYECCCIETAAPDFAGGLAKEWSGVGAEGYHNYIIQGLQERANGEERATICRVHELLACLTSYSSIATNKSLMQQ
jgi:hypothetical protein